MGQNFFSRASTPDGIVSDYKVDGANECKRLRYDFEAFKLYAVNVNVVLRTDVIVGI